MRHMKTGWKRLFRLTILLLSVFCLPGLTPGAAAQGTMGMLPDPITTAELSEYADRLGLSDQQQLAMQEAHDAYRQRFTALRQGEIADFLSSMNQISGSMPSQDAFEEFLSGLVDARKKIERIDQSLFIEARTFLTEDQLALVPRVEMARERHRCRSSQITMMTGGTPLDLSELVLDLELTPEQRTTIDPLLSGYERKLTNHMTDLVGMTGDIFRSFYTAAEEAGFTEGDATDDPEQAMEMARKMAEIQQVIMVDVRERGQDIRDLNARSYRSLVGTLGDSPAASALRDGYAMRVVPTASWTLRGTTAWIEGVRQIDSLRSDQHEAIEATLATFEQSADTIIRNMIQEAERTPIRDPFAAMMLGDEEDEDAQAFQEAQERIEELGTDLQNQLAAAQATVNEILDDQQKSQLGGVGATATVSINGMHDIMVQTITESEVVEAVENEPSMAPEITYFNHLAPFAGTAATPTEIRMYEKFLSLDEAGRAVLDQLFSDYRDQVQAFHESHSASLQEASSSRWVYDEDTGQGTLNPDYDPEKLSNLQEKARSQMLTIDREFLDSIDAALAPRLEDDDDPAARPMQRVRMLRTRNRMPQNHHHGGYIGAFGSGGTFVELCLLIESLRLSPDEQRQADDLLFAYEVVVTEELEAQVAASRTLQDAMEKWQRKQMAAQADQNDPEQAIMIATSYWEDIAEHQQAVHDVRNRVMTMTSNAAESIAAALDRSRGDDLLRRYRHQAYPDIYNDEHSAERRLSAALAIEDLTDLQREQIINLATDFRPAHEAVCSKLIALSQEHQVMPSGTMSQEETAAWQRQWEQQQTLRFERDENCARVISKLHAVLNDEQTARINLPKLEADRDGQWWD